MSFVCVKTVVEIKKQMNNPLCVSGSCSHIPSQNCDVNIVYVDRVVVLMARISLSLFLSISSVTVCVQLTLFDSFCVAFLPQTDQNFHSLVKKIIFQSQNVSFVLNIDLLSDFFIDKKTWMQLFNLFWDSFS